MQVGMEIVLKEADVGLGALVTSGTMEGSKQVGVELIVGESERRVWHRSDGIKVGSKALMRLALGQGRR